MCVWHLLTPPGFLLSGGLPVIFESGTHRPREPHMLLCHRIEGQPWKGLVLSLVIMVGPRNQLRSWDPCTRHCTFRVTDCPCHKDLVSYIERICKGALDLKQEVLRGMAGNWWPSQWGIETRGLIHGAQLPMTGAGGADPWGAAVHGGDPGGERSMGRSCLWQWPIRGAQLPRMLGAVKPAVFVAEEGFWRTQGQTAQEAGIQKGKQQGQRQPGLVYTIPCNTECRSRDKPPALSRCAGLIGAWQVWLGL